jgi:arylformamidase
MKFIDITRPVEAGMDVYSADEGFSAQWQKRLPGDGYNLSRFSMGAHCGTHLDAPKHFLDDGLTIERAPMELLNGPALVIDVRAGFRPELVPGGTERIQLKGAFSGLSGEDAEALIAKGVRLVGTSMLSIGRPESESESHIALLGGGAWILENLRLEGVDDGWYEMMCLPLPLVGLEASPARAVLTSKDP